MDFTKNRSPKEKSSRNLSNNIIYLIYKFRKVGLSGIIKTKDVTEINKVN